MSFSAATATKSQESFEGAKQRTKFDSEKVASSSSNSSLKSKKINYVLKKKILFVNFSGPVRSFCSFNKNRQLIPSSQSSMGQNSTRQMLQRMDLGPYLKMLWTHITESTLNQFFLTLGFRCLILPLCIYVKNLSSKCIS